MAQRDQLAAPLGRDDAGDAGGAQNLALGDAPARDRADGGGLEHDEAFRDGLAARDRLVADVHHAGLASGGKVGQFWFGFRHATRL